MIPRLCVAESARRGDPWNESVRRGRAEAQPSREAGRRAEAEVGTCNQRGFIVCLPPMPTWYFAYGSNMCGAIFRERRGMRPLETRVAWLDGHRLCFDIPVGPGTRGVANLTVDSGTRVCGVAYLLDEAQLELLDRSEGVHVGVYRRVDVELRVGGDGRLAAFTYQSTMTTTGRLPSPRYMGLLLDGAVEHGLPDEYQHYLRSFELAVDERNTG